jgi:hypothetical protein
MGAVFLTLALTSCGERSEETPESFDATEKVDITETISIPQSILSVQQGHSSKYPSVTFEGAYNYSLKDPSWSEELSPKGRTLVNVKGLLKDQDLRTSVLELYLRQIPAPSVYEQKFWEKHNVLHRIYSNYGTFNSFVHPLDMTEEGTDDSMRALYRAGLINEESLTEEMKAEYLKDVPAIKEKRKEFIQEFMTQSQLGVSASFSINHDNKTLNLEDVVMTFVEGVKKDDSFSVNIDWWYDSLLSEE